MRTPRTNRAPKSKPALQTNGKGYQFAGAALRGRSIEWAKYSHALDPVAKRVVCNGPKYASFLDDECLADDTPTCPQCRRRLGLAPLTPLTATTTTDGVSP